MHLYFVANGTIVGELSDEGLTDYNFNKKAEETRKRLADEHKGKDLFFLRSPKGMQSAKPTTVEVSPFDVHEPRKPKLVKADKTK
jgi:hypothetical protein